jgi:hypothetical protein
MIRLLALLMEPRQHNAPVARRPGPYRGRSPGMAQGYPGVAEGARRGISSN